MKLSATKLGHLQTSRAHGPLQRPVALRTARPADVMSSSRDSQRTAIGPITVDPEKIKQPLALRKLKIHIWQPPVEAMSSGEARRVLIARALVHKPRALLRRACNSRPVRPASVRHNHARPGKTRARDHSWTHELADIRPRNSACRIAERRTRRPPTDRKRKSCKSSACKIYSAWSGNGAPGWHYHLW